MAQSSELETLDQLLGGEMSLSIIRQLYASDESFTRGVLALLRNGDVRLLETSGAHVAQWRWRSLFEEGEVLTALSSFALDITPTGAAKMS